MRISKIGYNYTPNFSGEHSGSKKKSIKNTVGAAAVALAAAVPSAEADAQYFVPIPPQSYYYYYNAVPTPVSVPNCFIYGDVSNFDTEKTMYDVFSEIDSKINENDVISMGEVVGMERDNWNKTHFYPYQNYQMQSTANNFRMLSNMFNEENSNPNTINFREYKKIMNAYMESKNMANFIDLMRILTIPRPICPPPHHHHRHRH